MPDVAALYVEPKGCYVGVAGVDAWDEARDARRYAGPYPVVAHPRASAGAGSGMAARASHISTAWAPMRGASRRHYAL